MVPEAGWCYTVGKRQHKQPARFAISVVVGAEPEIEAVTGAEEFLLVVQDINTTIPIITITFINFFIMTLYLYNLIYILNLHS